MAKRSQKITDNADLNCMWGLLGILHTNPKLISNGRHVIDHSRSHDHVTSFDEQCRKIKNVDVPRAQKRAMKDRDKTRRSPASHPLVALLEAVSAQDHDPEECSLSESYHGFRKCDRMDEVTMQQVLINSNKDRFVDLLPEPDSLLPRMSKYFRPSRTDRETIKSVLDAKLAEYRRENVRMNCGEVGSKHKGKMNKILALEPAQEVICNCSSVQYHKKLSRLISDAKPASFTFRETKKKLKDTLRSVGKEDNLFSMNGASGAADPTDGKNCKKREVDSNQDSRIHRKKPNVDVIFEAKRQLSERMKRVNEAEAVRDMKSSRTLRRILASPDHDFCPRRDNQYCSGSVQSRFSSYNTCGSPLRQDPVMTSLIPSPDGDCKTGKSRIVETNGIREASTEKKINDVITTPETSLLHKDDDSILHSLPDSVLENEAFTSTADDFQLTPSSVYQLDVVNNLKYHEEHQSPVSVLEPFFAEDANSPQNITLQTDRQTLQPLRLDFDEQSVSVSSSVEEQDHISEYVHSVLQASHLDWDRLSKIRTLSEELLHATVFNEVEFLLTDCCFDPKLLFDHIKEILTEIHQSCFGSCPFPAAVKPKILSAPLVEVVVDEVMTQTDFYLLPRTEKRTLDQLVSKDVKNSQSWLDVGLDTEQIAVDVSEMLIGECIEELLLEPVT